MTSRPGAGPRHIDFHPKKALAYVINELDFMITTYCKDRRSGRADAAADDAAMPSDFTGYSTGAEIGSVAPAATSMSPIAATTASAFSR